MDISKIGKISTVGRFPLSRGKIFLIFISPAIPAFCLCMFLPVGLSCCYGRRYIVEMLNRYWLFFLSTHSAFFFLTAVSASFRFSLFPIVKAKPQTFCPPLFRSTTKSTQVFREFVTHKKRNDDCSNIGSSNKGRHRWMVQFYRCKD